MRKTIWQAGLLLVLVTGAGLIEAAIPFMVPSLERTDRSKHSTHLDGTLVGWQACVRDGRKSRPDKTATYLEFFCPAAYARPQPGALVTVSGLAVHRDDKCPRGPEPHIRTLSATLTNHSSEVQVGRLALNGLMAPGKETFFHFDLPVILQPGEERHQCLGVHQTFDTAADAALFDQQATAMVVTVERVYGMKKGGPKPAAAPSPFLLGENRS
jgi:hypothetical protein